MLHPWSQIFYWIRTRLRSIHAASVAEPEVPPTTAAMVTSCQSFHYHFSELVTSDHLCFQNDLILDHLLIIEKVQPGGRSPQNPSSKPKLAC